MSHDDHILIDIIRKLIKYYIEGLSSFGISFEFVEEISWSRTKSKTPFVPRELSLLEINRWSWTGEVEPVKFDRWELLQNNFRLIPMI